jgi:DNA-binding GntR family transcriptional regulator
MSGENTTGRSTPPRRAGGDRWTIFPEWSPDLLKARVYERILLDIILCVLAPGSRLDEAELARRYDAGLAGVREALGRLALEGLVVRRARAGTTVASLDLLEVRQAVEARRLIEPHCAALAASNAGPEDIDRLRAAFDGAEEAVRTRDATALVRMDQQFHEAIARASGNVTLARILIPLQHKAARFWVWSMGADGDAERLEEIARHQAVVDAIADGDPDRARGAVLRTLGAFSDDAQRGVNCSAEELALAPGGSPRASHA